LLTRYPTNRWRESHKLCNLGAAADKDDVIRFWGWKGQRSWLRLHAPDVVRNDLFRKARSRRWHTCGRLDVEDLVFNVKCQRLCLCVIKLWGMQCVEWLVQAISSELCHHVARASHTWHFSALVARSQIWWDLSIRTSHWPMLLLLLLI